jgi:hypothetical protein
MMSRQVGVEVEVDIEGRDRGAFDVKRPSLKRLRRRVTRR